WQRGESGPEATKLHGSPVSVASIQMRTPLPSPSSITSRRLSPVRLTTSTRR
ncbi:hypothetical protein FRB90_010573, partial [Tulasnella sp. 427]